jgi:hypothetical protein
MESGGQCFHNFLSYPEISFTFIAVDAISSNIYVSFIAFKLSLLIFVPMGTRLKNLRGESDECASKNAGHGRPNRQGCTTSN